ncbi:MAG TPA: hypothetical protein VEL74_11085 [Thermoanaerobaculia bacterium]|nr:hypothetical protein [Thermoanaerobaculia bacterium]
MKKPLTKLVFALALSTAALVTSAQPSHALYCGQRPGCTFQGVFDYGGAICCTYDCNGLTRIGPCQQV